MKWKMGFGALSLVGFSLASCGGGGAGDASVDPSSEDEQASDLVVLPAATTLVAGETQIRDIAVDSGDVYWISAKVLDPNQPTNSVGRVAHVSKQGGAVHVVANAQHGGGSVALNGKTVFWTATATSHGATVPAIFSAPRAGGSAKRFAPTWTGFVPAIFAGNPPMDPPFLLADDTRVFAVGDEQRLYRIPIATEKPEFLVEGANHTSIATSSHEVFESECRTCGGFIAESSKTAASVNGDVGAGASINFIEDQVCCVWSMTVSQSSLYWASLFDGIVSAQLNGAPKPAAPPVTLVPPSDDPAQAARWIAVVAPHLYWTTASGALRRVAQTGGAVTTVIASGVDPDVRITADSDSVYWVSANAGSIERTRVR